MEKESYPTADRTRTDIHLPKLTYQVKASKEMFDAMKWMKKLGKEYIRVFAVYEHKSVTYYFHHSARSFFLVVECFAKITNDLIDQAYFDVNLPISHLYSFDNFFELYGILNMGQEFYTNFQNSEEGEFNQIQWKQYEDQMKNYISMTLGVTMMKSSDQSLIKMFKVLKEIRTDTVLDILFEKGLSLRPSYDSKLMKPKSVVIEYKTAQATVGNYELMMNFQRQTEAKMEYSMKFKAESYTIKQQPDEVIKLKYDFNLFLLGDNFVKEIGEVRLAISQNTYLLVEASQGDTKYQFICPSMLEDEDENVK